MSTKTVETGRPFFLPYRQTADNSAGIGLTGTAGESKGCNTPKQQEPVRVVGGISDIKNSQVSLSDGSGVRVLSNAPVPIGFAFGLYTGARPYLPYANPLFLDDGNFLRATVLNVGGEGSASNPANIVHLCEPVNDPHTLVTYDPDDSIPFWMAVPLVLAGTAKEEKDVTTPVDRRRDTLIWGMATDLAAVRLKARDDQGGEWCGDFVPVWAMAGNAGAQIPEFLFPRPYLLRAGGVVTFTVRNPSTGMESNGNLYLLCSKIRKQS